MMGLGRQQVLADFYRGESVEEIGRHYDLKTEIIERVIRSAISVDEIAQFTNSGS